MGRPLLGYPVYSDYMLTAYVTGHCFFLFKLAACFL